VSVSKPRFDKPEDGAGRCDYVAGRMSENLLNEPQKLSLAKAERGRLGLAELLVEGVHDKFIPAKDSASIK